MRNLLRTLCAFLLYGIYFRISSSQFVPCMWYFEFHRSINMMRKLKRLATEKSETASDFLNLDKFYILLHIIFKILRDLLASPTKFVFTIYSCVMFNVCGNDYILKILQELDDINLWMFVTIIHKVKMEKFKQKLEMFWTFFRI